MLNTLRGKILKATGGFYYVEAQSEKTDSAAPASNGFAAEETACDLIECRAKGIFRKEGISPCCGDNVEISCPEQGYNVIEKIFPRKNHMVRPPLSNIDLLCIIASTDDPKINYYILDKMLAISQYKGIKSAIIVTKTDLSDGEEEQVRDVYKNSGTSVAGFCSKSDNKDKIGDIRALIDGKTVAFIGNSGVGKSTLMNSLLPKLNLETGEISKKLGRGRHTTRTVELFKNGSGYIADTPGFSTVELQRYETIESEELKECFPEFSEFTENCRFNTCLHICEKGCAVLDAVQNGEIPKSRHSSYVMMLNEIKENKKW